MKFAWMVGMVAVLASVANAAAPVQPSVPVPGEARTVTEAELARANALPAGKDWPWYYGVTGAMRGPDSGAVMIDDLAKACLAWKSEDAMPCCRGNAPDGRYASRATYTGTTGGTSSPVVAGGIVYQFYCSVPEVLSIMHLGRCTGTGGCCAVLTSKNGAQGIIANLSETLHYYRPAGEVPAEKRGDLAERGEKVPDSPIEKAAMEDFLRTLAGDVVVALDAATGKTLWKTTTPMASVNHQTYKWRGFNPTPFVDVGRGTVYVLNYSNRLYSLDAKTGAVKWRYDGAASRTFAASGAGAVAVGSVVAFPAGENLICLDAASGKELRKQPGGNVRP